jgi:hypothetical protein
VFSLGMHFLHFVASRHADAFQWRDPKQGYEYNFQVSPRSCFPKGLLLTSSCTKPMSISGQDPPLLLILGHEKWWDLFEGLRTGAKSESGGSEQELDAYLRWAYDESQRFASESASAHLY